MVTCVVKSFSLDLRTIETLTRCSEETGIKKSTIVKRGIEMFCDSFKEDTFVKKDKQTKDDGIETKELDKKEKNFSDILREAQKFSQ